MRPSLVNGQGRLGMAKQTANGADSGYQLPFEKAIARLQREIANMEAEQGTSRRDCASEIRQLRSQYVSLLRKTYQNLTPWETVQVARHPARPLAGDYIERDRQGLRRAARRPPLRRRQGHPLRAGADRRGEGRARRPSTRAATPRRRSPATSAAPPGGLPQGPAGDEAGREVPPAGGHADRHARGVSRRRQRGARRGRGHRPQPAGDEPAEDADRVRGHRRGRQRRGLGHRRGRPHRHDGVRLLLGHQPRGLRGHPVADAARRPPRPPRP